MSRGLGDVYKRQLEAHEQAELTERLSDYYSPDDVELQPAPKSEAKS